MEETSDINSILLSNKKTLSFYYLCCCCWKTKKNVAFLENSDTVIDTSLHNENYIFRDVEDSLYNNKNN